jgi:hypothetical protein
MDTGKLFIVLGIICIAVGLVLTLGWKIPFLGNLPGDIHIKSGNTEFYFPIVSCLAASVILSVVLNLFFHR